MVDFKHKKSMINFDKALLNNILTKEFNAYNFCIGKLKLNSHYTEIDFFEINDIYIIKPEQKTWGNENANYTIKERFEMLLTYAGWLHLAGGLSINVQNSYIKQFRLSKKYIEPIKSLDKNHIIAQLGKADLELIDDTMWGLDYSVNAFISIYKKGMLNIFFDPDNLNINTLIIGEMDKSNYSKK